MVPKSDTYCRAFGGPRPIVWGDAYLTILCCGGLSQARTPALAMAWVFFTAQWLDQIGTRINKTAVVGGVDIQVPGLKPSLDEPMMSELIARCCEFRYHLLAAFM